MFDERLDFITSNKGPYVCVVIEEVAKSRIVGSGTVFMERKFIHECSNCGHIEDIVVHDEMRGKGLGKL
jgi:glucosamine-phosphate N-acetyltransferase